MRKEEAILFPVVAASGAAVASGQALPGTPFGTVANPIHMMEVEDEKRRAGVGEDLRDHE